MRWLLALLLLCPSAVWAAACEKGQAFGHSGQAGPFEEVARLFTTTSGIVLLLLTLFALYLRRRLLLWLIAALWLYALYKRNFNDPHWLGETAEYAMGEGCVGPMWLSNIIGVFLVAMILLISLKRKPRHA